MKRAPEAVAPAPTPSPGALFHVEIRKAADAIRSALEGLEPGVQPELKHVSAAFVEVERVIEFRRRSRTNNCNDRMPGATALALAGYRAALAEWDRQLPRLHGWLLAERARLSARRAHAGSVETWIETDRQTR